MCGIAGIFVLDAAGAPPALEELTRMAGALEHRGPEQFGLYRDARTGLAHARLSIIDLSTGQQPLSNEDATLWVVLNGEIFNYVELRHELIAAGHTFRTESDTEVVVHAYERWGEAAFERFNGQWALALWDERKQALVLSRDPFGVRPLYYCAHRGRLYFASEVKAIFAADPSIPRAFDPVGLTEIFTFWTVVAPRSVFRGVSELEPAHVRIYSGDAVGDREYWRPAYPEGEAHAFRGSPAEAAEATLAALEAATRLRVLRADVPVGSYLSGGLDSSLVAALGLRATAGRFQTFSLRFEDAEYDETPFQRLMAARLGSDHHEVVVSRGDIARAFPDVIWHAERPVLRAAPAPLYLLSRLVHERGIKVVLTGEGADEMFAGYDLFREGQVRRFWARQPHSTARPRLLDRLYPYLSRSPVAQQAMARQFFGRNLSAWRSPGFAHQVRWDAAAALVRLFSAEQREVAASQGVVSELLSSLPPEFARWSFLAQDQYLEIRTLLSGYLLSAQGDRMLMAHSVEGRFPFLDRHVASLASSLPARYKLCGLDEKHVLKRAAAGLVPQAILARTKQPYRAPDALSFAGPDRPAWVDEVLSERALADAAVFDVGAARQVYNKCLARHDEGQYSNADNMALVGILSTQLLHRQFVGDLPVAGPPRQVHTVIDHLAAASAP